MTVHTNFMKGSFKLFIFLLTVRATCTEFQQLLLAKGARLLCDYQQRTVMFEEGSNHNSYCDSLSGEHDHGIEVHNNSEAFQQIVTTSSNEKVC